MTGVGDVNSNDPAEPYYWLRKNADFQMLFADRAHKHLFNGGALTTAAAVARYQTLADAVTAAVTAESARWGDVVAGMPFKPTDWQNERDWILNTYLPQRNGSLMQQLRNRGLYPSTEAPALRVNGAYQHGGTFQLGASLSMTAPAGKIYYSLDGSDPRLPGGAIRQGALVYSGPLTMNANYAREVTGVPQRRVERDDRGDVLRRPGSVDPHHRDHVQPGAPDRRRDGRRLR